MAGPPEHRWIDEIQQHWALITTLGVIIVAVFRSWLKTISWKSSLEEYIHLMKQRQDHLADSIDNLSVTLKEFNDSNREEHKHLRTRVDELFKQ